MSRYGRYDYDGDDTHIRRCTCGAWRWLTWDQIEDGDTARILGHPDPNPCPHFRVRSSA